MTARAVVIGAGLAGIAAAVRLRGAGWRVRVLEAGPRAGGVVGTERLGEWAFETGPNSFTSSARSLRGLAAALGLEEEIVASRPEARRRYVYRGARMHPLPSSPPGLLTSRLLTLGARMRVLAEPFRGDRPPGRPESLGAWIGRRFGDEVVERLLDPFVSGVYGGDVGRLGAADAFPALYAAAGEAGSVVRGAVRTMRQARREAPDAPRGGALWSLAGGLGTLPAAAEAAFGADLRTGAAARTLARDGSRFRVAWKSPSGGDEEEAEAVVCAVPAVAAGPLLEGLLPGVSAALGEVESVPMRVLGLGFRRGDVTHPCDGFGALVPRSEGTRLLGVLWPSSVFPGRAPAGGVAMTVFVGGAHDRDVLERPLAEDRGRVLEELGAMLGVRGEPAVETAREWPRAVTQYVVGHRARMAAVASRAAEVPGLALAGNWLAGVSMEDTVASGEAAAGRVLATVGSAGAPSPA